MSGTPSEGTPGGGLPSPPWVERLIFAASLALVLGVAAALVVLDRPFTADATAIAARALPVDPAPRDGRLVVPVEVTNEGTTSADDVVIEVRLGGPTDERRELHLAHLPQGARKRGTVVFYTTARSARPTARVVSYMTP
jgi:uncharacterized protein (TIGR02588 family)